MRLELQADCFAGVWAHTAYQRQILEDGDLEEGLTAAAAIGDDRLQSQAGQQVNRESFTHGTSEQRTRWFLKGFEGGEVAELRHLLRGRALSASTGRQPGGTGGRSTSTGQGAWLTR